MRISSCGAERNYTGYCNAEVDKLIDRQSMASPMSASANRSCGKSSASWRRTRRVRRIFYPISAACWQPYFKGHTMMVNGNYNGWRFEDAWLDK